MKSQMFFQIFDICITCFELGGYFYLSKAEKRKRQSIYTILYFIILLMAVVLMSAIEMPIFPKYGAIILLLSVGGSITFDCSVFKNVLYGIVFVFCVQSSDTLAMQIWKIMNASEDLTYSSINASIISLVIAGKGIFFLFIAVSQKIMQKNVDNKMKLIEIIPVLISGIPFILVLECLNVSVSYIKDSKFGIFSVGSSILILLVFVFDMVFTQYYNAIRKKAMLEEHTINELQLKYDYYKNKKEDEAVIREIYHDLKNYFLIYKDDLISEELRKKLSAYESYYMTGNELLDVIISDKLRKAYNNNIQVECKVDFQEGGFIEALDISTIFGNMLDNAIEACVKLPEDDRFIWINAGKKRQFMLIHVKNTTTNKVMLDNILTDKTNKYLHGYGIPNIKKAVNKYNGECSIVSKDNIFEMTIVIPIKAKEGMEYEKEN